MRIFDFLIGLIAGFIIVYFLKCSDIKVETAETTKVWIDTVYIPAEPVAPIFISKQAVIQVVEKVVNRDSIVFIDTTSAKVSFVDTSFVNKYKGQRETDCGTISYTIVGKLDSLDLGITCIQADTLREIINTILPKSKKFSIGTGFSTNWKSISPVFLVGYKNLELGLGKDLFLTYRFRF